MITDYQIEMLNVGDADAFVVYYITDRTRKHLVLIDAGRYEDGTKVLEHLNAHYRGIPVELAIVTHPDDDHYGGFVYLLDQIKNKNKDAAAIQRFWVNDPRKHIKMDDVKEDIQKKTIESRLKNIYAAHDTDLMTLLDECKIPYQEAFAKTYSRISTSPLGTMLVPECCSSDQIGFTILGPTKNYYEAQCQNFRFEHLHVEVGTEAADVVDNADFVKTDRCLSKVLDDAPDDDSDHNRSSLIVLFEPEHKVRFLFTGDASVDSFEHMTTTHQLKCKDLRWLKVPHHGSKRNLNSKWIKYFNPSIAYISTLKRGQYLNQCVVNALKKNGCDVISTHNNPTFSCIVHNNCLERQLKAVVHC
jgi:beta-lactamase superfamily II metal-dependent hydrolase